MDPSLSVCGAQPAVVVVPVRGEDGVDHEVLSLRGHAGEVSRVRLTGSPGLSIVHWSLSSLVTEARVVRGCPASLAATRLVSD